MKRHYTKPHLYVEHFTLTEHIAANCMPGLENYESAAIGFRNSDSCGFRFDADNILFYNSNCNVPSYEMADYQEYGITDYNGLEDIPLSRLFVS